VTGVGAKLSRAVMNISLPRLARWLGLAGIAPQLWATLTVFANAEMRRSFAQPYRSGNLSAVDLGLYVAGAVPDHSRHANRRVATN
jgi:hypothetical protein